MTERTTRIWVDLTDEHMDKIENHWVVTPPGSVDRVIQDAVVAQRPRPIAAGDRVRYNGGKTQGVTIHTVEAIVRGRAWLWTDGKAHCSADILLLARVDDEAAS